MHTEIIRAYCHYRSYYYINTYFHAYIHTYIHTYSTYIQIYNKQQRSFGSRSPSQARKQNFPLLEKLSPAPSVRGDIAGRAAPAVDPSPTHTEPGGHGLGGQTAATHRSAQAVGAARPGQAAGGEADSEE